MKDIRIHDLEFEPYIDAETITQTVTNLASHIDRDYADKNPILLVVLNGAFVFAADLVRLISIPIRLDFVKISSYSGTTSTSQMNEHFRWQQSLKGQHVLIIEDIVDTGHTLSYLKDIIRKEEPASVEIACLLIKPKAYLYNDPVAYQGLPIPNDFVVGYGLDYNGLGRDIPCIYKKKD